MNSHKDPESRLATLATKLLGIAMGVAQRGSDWRAVEEAAKLHIDGKLYPRMTISMQHGGGGVHVLVTLCDPETDEVIVRMFECEAKAEDVCTH